MSAHYYFVASLPTLQPDVEPELSTGEFLTLAQRYVGERDFERLTNAKLDDRESPPATPVYAAWRAFDADLREQLLGLRAAKLGWDAAAHTRSESPVFTTEETRAIFDEPDPLRAERRLFRLRWRFLDEIDRAHFMRLENLVVYALKLQLIEQLLAMSPERGRESLDTIRGRLADELPNWEAAA